MERTIAGDLDQERQAQASRLTLAVESAEKITRMTTRIKPLTQRLAWKALAAHYKKVQNLHLRKLFADDSKRGEHMSAGVAGLFLDYSKNRITDQTIKLLVQLANESDLRGRIEAMFSGEKINVTENRAVLHVALRAPKGATSGRTEKTSCRRFTPCSKR
jgi:glucose-6-phosphate isomerase